jgi:outer membrane protein assembly factor BamB
MAMIICAGTVAIIGTVYGLKTVMQREETAFKQAQEDYDSGKYHGAADRFRKLVENFSGSTQRPYYQFLLDLSEVRDQVYSPEADPSQARDRMNTFLETYRESPDIKKHTDGVRQTLLKLAELLALQAEQRNDRALLSQAKQVLADTPKFRGQNSPSNDQKPVQQLIAQAGASITKWQKHHDALAEVKRMTDEAPSIEAIHKIRRFIEREGLEKDNEAAALLSQFEERVRQQVRYVAQQSRGPLPQLLENVEPSLLVAPLIGGRANGEAGAPLPAGKAGRVVLALVRGVLYALDPQRKGEILWATRVGIDTTALPVRLLATPISPELFLVLSADSKTLVAREADTGKPYWHHELSAPCLGRPVVVHNRAYVPTYDGKVHEIEIIGGNLLGYFDLGQPLTVGGVWQEGTDWIYMPGDSDNLYVLDTALTNSPNQPARPKKCVAILHTGHPSGSLRSEPIIINRQDPFAADPAGDYLVLTQADGLEHMKLRVYSLPIDNADAPSILQPEPRIRGWSWFQPYHDSEKLAFVTDTGTLGLFGINQVRNVDPPLFPELPEDPKTTEAVLHPGRAQVVHAIENNFWVLASGELQWLHFDLVKQKTAPLWSPASLHLGWPLHASQIDESGKTLFVVTQDPDRQSYLATAVEAETGKILWQRQLGLDCQGDPVVLGGRVLVVDRGGELARFEPGKQARVQRQEWNLADPALEKPLGVGVAAAYLLPAGDGESVYEIASAERGKQLIIRKYRPAAAGKREPLETHKVELPAPLAGPPSVGPRSILLSLANESIVQLSLPLDGSPFAGGPNWRASRVDEDARGHVVHLTADEFLTTDGSRGLSHWIWPKDQDFHTIDKRVPTVQMPARIVAAPVVLPKANAEDELRVVVADADDRLTLLSGPQLKIDRTWSLGGKITAGPFVRGQRIGCIVNRLRLVWIDPSQPRELWTYEMKGGDIVGQPQLIGDMLVVADESGRFVGLDPENGLPRGKGYTLKIGAAPVATPVAFGPDEAFVPLTDGTVFLLALRQLRDQPGPGP